MASEAEGYKDHRAGSNKGKVHKVFDEKGKDAAIKKAVALELSESTARTWCSTWGKKSSSKKASSKASKTNARKPAGKKTAKKAAPKKREKLAA